MSDLANLHKLSLTICSTGVPSGSLSQALSMAQMSHSTRHWWHRPAFHELSGGMCWRGVVAVPVGPAKMGSMATMSPVVMMRVGVGVVTPMETVTPMVGSVRRMLSVAALLRLPARHSQSN